MLNFPWKEWEGIGKTDFFKVAGAGVQNSRKR